MPAHPGQSAQGSDSQSAGFALDVSGASESDQLALDMRSKRPCQFEWIAFAPAE
jgi:hypothetical protein